MAVTLAIAALASSHASAHRRDELLQAARIAIGPARVELQLDLTPGIEVADAVIADIDRNRDGVLSPDERRQYIAKLLRAVALDVDGADLRLTPTAFTFPGADAFVRGDGTIRLRADAALPSLSNGGHHLAYRNRNRPDISVYLANALVPDDDRVAVHAQRRDTDQRDLTIDYELRTESRATEASWSLLAVFATVAILLGARYRRRVRVPAVAVD